MQEKMVAMIGDAIQGITCAGSAKGFTIFGIFFVGENKAKDLAGGIYLPANLGSGNRKFTKLLGVYAVLP